MNIGNMFANWKTTILGIGMIVVGALQAAKAPTVKAGLQRADVQMAIAAGVLGLLAKDHDK